MTRIPPSGQFPTGYSMATASLCTGCDVVFNGSGLVNGTTTGRPWPNQYPNQGGNSIPISGYGVGGWSSAPYGPQSLLGLPLGALTGQFPSIFPMGEVRITYNRATDGRCQPQTGAIIWTGNTGSSGVPALIYTAITGCTGTSGCKYDLQVWFEPGDAFLSSSGMMIVGLTDYCNGNYGQVGFNFPFFDGLGNPRPNAYPSGYIANLGWPLLRLTGAAQNCGQYCFYDVGAVYYPVLASGYGSLVGATGWSIGCTPCTGT